MDLFVRPRRPPPKRRSKLLWIGVPIAVVLVLWWTRPFLARLLPIRHQGVVKRIARFKKDWRNTRTRQQVQFAIIFDDGFQCEGYDTSFAAIREGDRIEIRGYHDVAGWPIINPEWWECDEAQLIELVADER